MFSFYDCCCLLQYSRSDGPIILKHVPEKYYYIHQKRAFLVCSFPESKPDNTVYSFSIKRHRCFAWSFYYQDQLYSIVVITHHCFAYYYTNFMKFVSIAYQKYDPLQRMNLIMGLLDQWSSDPHRSLLHMSFPERNFSVPIGIKDCFYLEYNPAHYIGEKNLEKVWHSLISNTGVLIIGDNPGHISCAVYSALSLIAPVKFCEPMLIYTRYGDMRFADMICGESKWKIVGTSNRLPLERCKQFETVIVLQRPTKHKSNKDIREKFNKRTSFMVKHIEAQLNKNLMKDPFSDILQKPLAKDQIRDIVNKMQDIKLKELSSFLESQSFVEWRYAALFRPQFREAILSFSPEAVLKNRTDDDLDIITKELRRYKKRSQQDTHLKTVINKYLSILKTL